MSTIIPIDLTEEIIKFHEMDKEKRQEWMDFFRANSPAVSMAMDFAKYHRYNNEETLELCVFMLCRADNQRTVRNHNEQEKDNG